MEAAKESSRLARPIGLQPGSVQPPVGGSLASVKVRRPEEPSAPSLQSYQGLWLEPALVLCLHSAGAHCQAVLQGRAASQPLPGGITPPPGFPTLHSNTASDTAFAAGSVLGLHGDLLGSTPADHGPQPQTACVSSMPHAAPERAQPLDSFGSLISNMGNGQFRKGPIKGASAGPSSGADVSMARASSMPFKSEGGCGQASLFGQRSKPGGLPTTNAACAAPYRNRTYTTRLLVFFSLTSHINLIPSSS